MRYFYCFIILFLLTISHNTKSQNNSLETVSPLNLTESLECGYDKCKAHKSNDGISNLKTLSSANVNNAVSNSNGLLPQQTNLVLGPRTVLVVRGVDPATHTWTNTDQELATLNTELDNYLQNVSFNKTSIGTFDITPVYDFTVDPNNNGYFAMSQTLRTIAINDGFNVDDYNVVMYIHQSSTDFGGAGALGSGNGLNGTLWANNNLTWYYQGNIHETFHALGVGHSETIEGGQFIYPGSVTGGHDPYHFMGSEGDAGLNSDVPSYMQYFFGWIDPSEIICLDSQPTACETHRIYKSSLVSTYNPSNKYAIQLGQNLWISYEPDNANTRIEKKGLLLHYIPGPGSAVTRLLDTRPNTITTLPPDLGSNWAPVIDFWDAAMEVGDVITWEGTSIEMVAIGGTGDEKWVDIEFCNCSFVSGDTDNDGVCDIEDACPGNDDSLDADADLVPDACDVCPLAPNDDSNNDGICDNEQCLTFSAEAFDYPVNTVLDGENGGTAFNGAWNNTWESTPMNGSIEVLSNSLSFSGHNSTGNKLRITLQNESETKGTVRTLDSPILNGETFWLSCLVKAEVLADGGFWIRPNGNQAFAIGKRWGSNIGIDNNGTGISIQQGEVFKLVARYQLLNNETVVHLWVNRNNNFTEANSDATKTIGIINEVNNLSLYVERWGDGVVEIDELLISCQSPENNCLINGDSDGDGICNPVDVCVGGDDLLDTNGNNLPDDCEMAQVNLSVILEGAFNPSTNLMKTTLADENLIPLTHPYGVPPYNHTGTESIPSIPPNMVDWVLVEARTGTTNSTKIETKAGLLLNDGSIVAPDGASPLLFDLLPNSEVYFLIRHRNHLDVMTGTSLTRSLTMNYDFRSNTAMAYGTNQQNTLANGQVAMISADINQDHVIQTTDYDQWQFNPALLSIYNNSDTNLDGSVQATDYDLWFANKAKVGPSELAY